MSDGTSTGVCDPCHSVTIRISIVMAHTVPIVTRADVVVFTSFGDSVLIASSRVTPNTASTGGCGSPNGSCTCSELRSG